MGGDQRARCPDFGKERALRDVDWFWFSLSEEEEEEEGDESVGRGLTSDSPWKSACGGPGEGPPGPQSHLLHQGSTSGLQE